MKILKKIFDALITNVLWVIIAAMFVIAIFPSSAKAETVIMGEPTLIRALFCNTQEQLIILHTEYNKNGYESAEKLRVGMEVDDKVPCGYVTFLVAIEEELFALKSGGEQGVVVKATAAGFVAMTQFGEQVIPMTPIVQYFWTTLELKEKKTEQKT